MWNVQLCIYVAKYLTKTLAFFFNVFMPLRYASVNRFFCNFDLGVHWSYRRWKSVQGKSSSNTCHACHHTRWYFSWTGNRCINWCYPVGCVNIHNIVYILEKKIPCLYRNRKKWEWNRWEMLLIAVIVKFFLLLCSWFYLDCEKEKVGATLCSLLFFIKNKMHFK